jgi:hypothetical protein
MAFGRSTKVDPKGVTFYYWNCLATTFLHYLWFLRWSNYVGGHGVTWGDQTSTVVHLEIKCKRLAAWLCITGIYLSSPVATTSLCMKACAGQTTHCRLCNWYKRTSTTYFESRGLAVALWEVKKQRKRDKNARIENQPCIVLAPSMTPR